MRLVPWLAERQRELREGDRPFGRRLGVSGTFWGLVRRGERGLSLRIVRAACREWPDQRSFILSMAIDDKTECAA